MLANGPTDQDWNNQIKLIDGPLIYYNRGAWPNTPDSGSIVVGALGYFRNFYQATFSNYGPGVDIFAPGQNIISTFNNIGIADSKYSAGNYIYPISGTSMASPQVAGAIALAASGKNRFTQSDATKYLKDTQISDELSFNFGINLNLSEAEEAGSFLDFTAQKGSPNLTLAVKNTRPASGQIEEIKCERKVSGQVYPRQPKLYG
jgi:subtilisin family serine protease